MEQIKQKMNIVIKSKPDRGSVKSTLCVPQTKLVTLPGRDKSIDLNAGVCVYQQGYTQQDYSSYGQPAATESAYGQTAPPAGGYAQQQYGASYGQTAAPGLFTMCWILLLCPPNCIWFVTSYRCKD